MSFANKNGALLLHDVAIANNSTPLYESLAQVTGKPTCNASVLSLPQDPVVQKLDNAIHRTNRYPEDKYYENQLRYPLDSNLSSG